MKIIMQKAVVLIMFILLFTPSCMPPSAVMNVTCSTVDLVEAIGNANADAAADVLELAPGCAYTLDEINTTVTTTNDGTTFDYGDAGLPPITTPITINANEATISRAADAPAFRLFHILPTGKLTLNDLTLSNGFADDTENIHRGSGGAIYNSGILTVNRSTLSSNQAGFHGGAIFNIGNTNTQIKDSTIRDNSAPLGGGIFEYQAKLLSVENSNILNNTASTEGGGINVGYGSELIVQNSVISFNHSGRRGGGIFKDAGASRLPTTISGSTFEGNTAEWGGGGVFIWRTPLMLTSSTFLQNEAGEYGGGLGYQNNSTETVTIRSTTFDGNTAGLDGGAIHFSGELLDVVNATFRDNTAENGGAIHNGAAALDTYIQRADTTMQILQSTFETNTARAAGGGIYNGGTLTVNHSSFSGNEAAAEGGGIHNPGKILIQDSTFQSNNSGSYGGGLNTQGATTVLRSTFVENSATHGGGLASVDGNTALLNDTFSRNSVSAEGGGVFNRKSGNDDQANGQLFATHITVVHNKAAAGGGIATNGGTLKIKSSIVALNSFGGDCSTSGSDLSAVAENLDHDSTCPGFTLHEDPFLNALADNGGPTQTHALQSDSPAIDAAPDCKTVMSIVVPLDQRGKTRPGGPACDLGAYERVEQDGLSKAIATGSIPTLVQTRDIVTVTPTQVQPEVTALKNANCRYGPGTAYDIADTLFADERAPLVGRNEANTWWQIKGPTFGSLCWVSHVTVEVNGSMEGVPVVVAAPPPTLTHEPPPPKPMGCYVYGRLKKPICTVPCPPNAVPGGACKP